MIMQGLLPPIAPNDPDHQMKLDTYEKIDQDTAKLEMEYGKVAPNAMQQLERVIKEHTRFLEMLNQPSNVENPFGGNQSPTLGLQAGQGAPRKQLPPGQKPGQPPPQGAGGQAQGQMGPQGEEGGMNV